MRRGVDLRDRDLQRDRVHCVAGEEVLSATDVARALADREQVEDVADVAEERIVPLPGEHLAAAGERRYRLGRQRVIVGRRARPDVVGRRRPAGDHARLATRDACHRVRLRGVAEEERPGLPLELEVVRDVRLPVAVAVDVDVVPRGGREGVVVRPRGRILARDEVADDRQRVGLVRRAERVEVGVVRRRVLRDQRCLPVARRVGRARPRTAEKRGHEGERYQRRRRKGDCELAHEVLLTDGVSGGNAAGR